jgi:hypothetical protein
MPRAAPVTIATRLGWVMRPPAVRTADSNPAPTPT